VACRASEFLPVADVSPLDPHGGGSGGWSGGGPPPGDSSGRIPADGAFGLDGYSGAPDPPGLDKSPWFRVAPADPRAARGAGGPRAFQWLDTAGHQCYKF